MSYQPWYTYGYWLVRLSVVVPTEVHVLVLVGMAFSGRTNGGTRMGIGWYSYQCRTNRGTLMDIGWYGFQWSYQRRYTYCFWLVWLSVVVPTVVHVWVLVGIVISGRTNRGAQMGIAWYGFQWSYQPWYTHGYWLVWLSVAVPTVVHIRTNVESGSQHSCVTPT